MSAAEGLELAVFDPADYLTTPELVMEYLNAVLAESDSEFLREALETVARAPVLNSLAGGDALSRSVSDFKRHPNFEAMAHLVAAMGLKLQVVAA